MTTMTDKGSVVTDHHNDHVLDTLVAHGNLAAQMASGFCSVEKSLGDVECRTSEVVRAEGRNVSTQLYGMESRLDAKLCDIQLRIEAARNDIILDACNRENRDQRDRAVAAERRNDLHEFSRRSV